MGVNSRMLRPTLYRRTLRGPPDTHIYTPHQGRARGDGDEAGVSFNSSSLSFEAATEMATVLPDSRQQRTVLKGCKLFLKKSLYLFKYTADDAI